MTGLILCCFLIGFLAGFLIGGGLYQATIRRFVRGTLGEFSSEEGVREVVERLKQGGGEAWAVGEFVRYALDNWM